MKAGVVVGFVLFVVATVLLWHPTTTSPTGEVIRRESLIERIGTDKKLEEPSPIFHEPTPEQRAVVRAKREKEQTELNRLKKISKPIPMKLVSGTLPLKVYGDGRSRIFADVIFKLKGSFRISHITARRSCYIESTNSNAPGGSPGFRISVSKDGKNWETGLGFMGCDDIDFDISPSITAEYVKMSISTAVVGSKGRVSTELFDPKFYGFRVK